MASWIARYLDFLGLDPAPPPDLATLRRITRVHLERVPFESVTSVLRRRASTDERVPPLDSEAMLDAWIDRRSGALCFEATEMVARLLAELGFDAYPVLGQISFPGSHQGVLVTIDGVRYLVDVGNGAPFFDPIPLDTTFEVHRAGLAYRFHNDGPNVSVQDRWIEGEWKPFCRYALERPDPVVREAAYQQHHVIGCSWVVDTITLIRSSDDEVWSLRDRQLTHLTVDGKTVSTIEDAEREYPRLASETFHLPALPIVEGFHALK